MLGLQLGEHRVVAVAIDEGGRLVARDEQPSAGDAGPAALAVLERVAAALPPGKVGVAAPVPDAEAVQRVVPLL